MIRSFFPELLTLDFAVIRRVGVIGSREFPDLAMVRCFVQCLPRDIEIVSGGARGVDRAAVDEARRLGMPFREFLADWDGLGKSAGHARNHDIIGYVDFVKAFWDGWSTGTDGALAIAKRQKKPRDVFIVGDAWEAAV